jgi:hypothetical protein
MTHWTPDELRTIVAQDEIHLSSRRPDGTLRPFITMWMVEVDAIVVVRSARQINPWYRRAISAGSGRIRTGSLEKDVVFEPFTGDGGAIDRAYHAKYDRYGARIVAGVVGPGSYARTLRLIASV